MADVASKLAQTHGARAGEALQGAASPGDRVVQGPGATPVGDRPDLDWEGGNEGAAPPRAGPPEGGSAADGSAAGGPKGRGTGGVDGVSGTP